ncbi:hypothetical protein [Terracidiphilus sp.]|jgi:hypothetical protein|uniref:hypothetical protein n=1 Tax=Terracidiphilus sp. TaxID=1964191 RepID=UPI003C185A11
MATMHSSYTSQSFRVIHPLHDQPEAKCESAGLDPIEMTRAVRLSLVALRVYLLGMAAMLLYHVVDLAGILHHTH